MKIIFLGLLIAVLVVYGLGDDSNEPANVLDMKTLIEVLKITIQDAIHEESKINNEEKEDNERKATKIEQYRKGRVEDNKQLLAIKNELSKPNLSTELRSTLQSFHDITADALRNGKQWNEKRIEKLNKEIRQSEELEEMNMMIAQYVNSIRHLINSKRQYA